MFSLTDMPSTTTMLSAYASLTGSMMLIRSFANEFIPHQFQGFLLSGLRYVLTPLSSRLTIVVDEFDGFSRNEVYEAVKVYLGTMISPWVQRLSVTKAPRDDKLTITIAEGEEIIDAFEGIQVKWRFFSKETKNYDPNMDQRRPEHYFELSFNKKHRERVLDLYLPYVLNKSKAIKEEKKVVKLHAYGAFHGDSGGNLWGSVNLDHPATFDTLAMDLEMKKALMEDLEMFVRRKEFYKRVGKAWKRGYLLYGPPGTGKSSLIAAMANYLKFDIYDLELASIRDNYELRRLVVATANRSILVIEDIDCSVELQNREVQTAFQNLDSQLTLSGILNFIDGLWSSCGDERIIVFTTNHKDRLDPALLRPGRMDIHVHMSYCTTYGFKLLASNYLGIADHHHLFEEIEGLLGKTEVTPAEVAEELMKSNDAEISLGGLVKFLKRKKMEKDETKVEVGKEDQIQEPKRQKIENAHQELPLRTSGRRVLTRIRGRGGRRGIFRRW